MDKNEKKKKLKSHLYTSKYLCIYMTWMLLWCGVCQFQFTCQHGGCDLISFRAQRFFTILILTLIVPLGLTSLIDFLAYHFYCCKNRALPPFN